MYFIITFFFLLSPFTLWAQNSSQHITIRPQYSDQDIANTPFDSLLIITDQDSESIDLNSYAGITSFSSGYDGQQETLFLQGAEGEDLLVLIDGIKVNDPSTPNGKFDLSLIDRSNIERIEILKGPQSGLYGADAFSGVMNIITKNKNQSKASFQYGAHNTYGLTLTKQQTYDHFTVGIHGNIKHSDGISALAIGSEKDGYDYKNAHLKLGYKKGFHSIKLQSTYLKKENDIDQGSIDDPNYTYTVETWRSRIYASTQLFNSFYKPELSYNYTKLHRHSLNLADNSSPTSENLIYRSHIHNVAFTNNLQWNQEFKTTVGLIFNQERMNDDYMSEKIMDTGSIFMQNALQLHSTHISASARYDDTSYNNNFFTYRLGISQNVSGVIVQGSYATAVKNPTLYQLYSSFGDSNLQEEKQKGGNLSFFKKWQLTSLKINFFSYQMENLIDFNLTTYKYYNYGKAKRKGYELIADYQWDDLKVSANYTYTIAVKDDGSYLLRRPRHQADLIFSYPLFYCHVKLKNSYIGKRNAYPSGTLPAFVKSDLSISYPYNKKIALQIDWKNIFNKDYEFIKGYQTEGSSIYGQLNYRL